MDDLINRQAAIDALESEKTYCTAYKDGYTHTDYFKQYNMGLTDGIKALNKLPSVQPEIIRCKDCKHKPYPSDNYNYDNGDCGFEIIFPDYRCPCQCDDGYYNRIPDDDWFCGNAERREDE